MKYVLALSFFFITLSSVAQSTEQLDAKYGFKTIKLDEDWDKYRLNLVYFNTISQDNITVYFYTPTNTDLYNIFSVRMEKIKLYIDNKTKRIVGISLIKTFPVSNTNHYQDAISVNRELIESFVALFGKASSTISTNELSGSDLGLAWVGDKVILKVVVTYLGIDKESFDEVSIFKTNFLKSKLENGF